MSSDAPRWLHGGMPLEAAVQAPAADVFSFAQWAPVSPYGNWSFWTGDFDGDGRADVLAYDSNSNGLLVGLNKWPERRFDFENSKHWAAVSEDGSWTFTPGHFAGDGRTDIVAYHTSGVLWIGRNVDGNFYFGDKSRWDQNPT